MADDDTLDERVNPKRQITLSRDPELSADLLQAKYPRADTEQRAIVRAMEDMVEWAEKGILPTDLLQSLQQFGRRAERPVVDVKEDKVELRCEQADVAVEIEQAPDDEEASVHLETDL